MPTKGMKLRKEPRKKLGFKRKHRRYNKSKSELINDLRAMCDR